MTVTARLAISLDGFAAGLEQGIDNPMGIGGLRNHTWAFGDVHPVDAAVLAEAKAGIGAYVMGRNMFDGHRGPWDLSWRGWWGEEPPYHCPVFVLTHHARDPLPMAGGTTFHFVTEGPEVALELAKEAAGDQRVDIAGGPSTVRHYLAAGEIDELLVHQAPVVLGAGEPLFAGVDVELVPLRVAQSPKVTHITYRAR
ncbi:dihydrofolate reductase family protein [Actinokineospora bangkokensis]|uniref:5-amino-6-(5-phosphoribosylamino)uracil reductase n=1 Tax=Actinokineospora bangkokensis TaxID=1193682 RepID=A0A1Q9LPM1_9PSEU|nr:dihydrofolate reductase family protein [Actinokineospora bangkokensis]OLR93996.1 5-amino-6-(5-phosphoribosylamino)uracil reductase [Actinokineospora bangkokensis]